jgi:hypothetical protein
MLTLFSTTAILAMKPAAAEDLDLTASLWGNIPGWHHTVTLSNDTNGDLYLDIPVMSSTSCVHTHHCQSINYLYDTDVPLEISGALVVTLRVDTTGARVFHHTEENTQCPANPPSVRPFFWAHNNSYNQGDRWWAHSVSLSLGPDLDGTSSVTVTLTVPLDPANWVTVEDGVHGDQDGTSLAWFNDATVNVSRIGVTFGGGCNYGHGVFVTGGTARFTIENYAVVPDCPTVTPCNGTTCVRTDETGAFDTQYGSCVTPAGTLMTCTGSQTIHWVSTNCKKASCCIATTNPCVCPTPCPSGSYNECR